jgi:hypothetical protein
MMDPEDLAYLRQIHKDKLETTKKTKKKKAAAVAEDVDEYESKVMERHNKLLDDEEIKKSVKSLLPIR